MLKLNNSCNIVVFVFLYTFIVTLDAFELHVSTRNRVPLTRAQWSRRFRRICRTVTERTLAYIAGHIWPITTNSYPRYDHILIFIPIHVVWSKVLGLCINNFCIDNDNETLIMSFDKVTSNEYNTVGSKSIQIFILFSRHFPVIVF